MTFRNVRNLNFKVYFILIIILSIGIVSCSKKEKDNNTLFKLKNAEETNIKFKNSIREDSITNIAFYAYMYNGGGVGIGDVNNDGLEDIYLTGNQVSSKLYLNQGDFKFKDITETANVTTSQWATGVSMVDINADGWLDIYVSSTAVGDGRKGNNLFFINQKLNESGEVHFKEMAKDFGLDDPGFTVQTAFFDYDNDGDLDVFMLRNHLEDFPQNTIRDIEIDGYSLSNDKLFRNDSDYTSGNLIFTEVTREAGILTAGYGLGIALSDFNKDGYTDIYVSNDFITNDLMYMNNGDGTFSNKSKEFLKHQSRHGMGVDVADYNNDGLTDILVLDMMPPYNEREKQMAIQQTYDYFELSKDAGYDIQYVRNTLQLNNGFNSDGNISFSEIGQFANVSKTDWSWSPLMADFDNDGYKDLFVSNGYVSDVTDLDYINYDYNNQINRRKYTKQDLLNTLSKLPQIKTSNYIFKNKGDLTYEDATQDWGLEIPSFSQGAAYGDLDNDGDLDLVINTINDYPLVYQNTSANHTIQIELKGNLKNPNAFGSKIILSDGDNKQFVELFPPRGFQSSMSSLAHFGTGSDSIIDKIKVIWPDGKVDSVLHIKSEKKITFIYDSLLPENSDSHNKNIDTYFSSTSKILHKHSAKDINDYHTERLLHQKYSMQGPGIAVADINNDGFDDVFINSDQGDEKHVLLQNKRGEFTKKKIDIPTGTVSFLGTGTLFFDYDNDGDQDLYIGYGGNLYLNQDSRYSDVILKNDGKGNFIDDSSALPSFFESTSSVSAADYDNDGDLDLFVASRVTPKNFPHSPKSFLLQNNNGKFKDVSKILPNGNYQGMISQTLWTDFDDDGLLDLIKVGELMPITFLKNTGTDFINITESSQIQDYFGLWNSITGADFDNDGDTDYIVGNVGENNPLKPTLDKPIEWFVSDFDNNGSTDAIMSYYNNDVQVPVHSRDLLIQQLAFMKKRFLNYKSYSEATINEVLTPEEISTSKKYKANYFSNSYIENLGGGKFMIRKLPVETQFSSIFGTIAMDVNQDNNLDIIFQGNNYAPNVQTGQYDASIGGVLLGDGVGNFNYISSLKSGFFVDRDARALTRLTTSNQNSMLLSTSHNDSLTNFISNNKTPIIPLESNDKSAFLKLENGKSRKVEFYYGEGHLSQKSRSLEFPKGIKSVEITKFNGKKRKIYN